MWFFNTELKFSNEGWRQLPGWIASLKHFWIVVFALAISLACGWLLVAVGAVTATPQTRGEQVLRVAGWVLDVTGLLMAVWSVNRRLGRHGGKSIFRVLKDGFLAFLRRFPFYAPDIVDESHLTARMGRSSLSAHVQHIPPRKSIEERLEWLEKRENEIQRALDGLGDSIAAQKREYLSKIENLQKEMEAKERQEAAEASRVATGDASWEITGLTLIVIGITFSTVPDLVAKLF